jgi:hypothetical protein
MNLDKKSKFIYKIKKKTFNLFVEKNNKSINERLILNEKKKRKKEVI